MKNSIFLSAVFCALVFLPIKTMANNKVALVIGNSEYLYAGDVVNAANDIKAISKKLKRLGFSVLERHDLTRQALRITLRQFTKRLHRDSIALVYFAGHGIRRHGKNYLMPVDSHLNQASDIDSHGFDVDTIISIVNQKSPNLLITLLDTCNNNPFNVNFHKRQNFSNLDYRLQQPSFANIRAGFIAYSTEPGNVAVDGFTNHSPFAAALLKYLPVPGLTIKELFSKVRLDVTAVTQGRQKPWLYSAATQKFCFAGCESDPVSKSAIYSKSNDSKKLLARMQNALTNKSLVDIKKISQLDKKQEGFLRELFVSHSSLTYAKLIPMYIPKIDYPQKILVKVINAVNLSGNRVIPSNAWSEFSIKVRMPDEVM